jgi:predicted Holliday junction resolvase-like endonuclease
VLLLIVWVVTGLVVLVVLGSVLFGVVSSLRRLGREVAAFRSELQPVLEQAQRSAARAAAVRERASEDD